MVRSTGKTFWLQCSGIPGQGVNWQTIAGLTANDYKITNSEEEIYTKDSTQFRELIVGGAVTSVEITGEAVVTNSVTHQFLRDTALYGSPHATFGVYDSVLQERIWGDFQLSSYQRTGQAKGATTSSCSLSSTGNVVVASGVPST